MTPEIKKAYTKLINKHFSAVQTDTELGLTYNWKLEKKSKLFWGQFREAEKEFLDLLK